MNVEQKHALKAWAYRKYKGRCAYCGCKLLKHEATLDHVVPKFLGGANRKDNIVLSCGTCNSRKANMTPQAWRVELNMPG